MPLFRNLPIRWKLSVAILGTTATALLVACTAFILYQKSTFKGAMVEKMTGMAGMLATSSTAAIQFQNKDDAADVLSGIEAEPEILAACLYTDDGKLFAQYTRKGTRQEVPASPGKDGPGFEGDRLLLFLPVKLNGQRIGTIHLQAGLGAINDPLRTYVAISGLVLAGSFLMALALAYWLQGRIAGPILTLSETARLVSTNRDYSVRARKESEDELGLLTDSFNQMLTDIQERTGALENASQSLRTQAAEITKIVSVLGSSASDILMTTNRLAATASETAAAVSQTTTTVEETRQTAQVSSQKAQLVSNSAQKAAQISQAGRKATEDAAEGMSRVQGQMLSLAESMVRLNEQSQAIGTIVATVEDLAGQSQLLAVNAAIEAAKAGEHGRGFSVVAHEVRNMAEQSKQATTQVRTILRDIQKATNAAMIATDQSSKAVEAGVRESGRAGESILTLAESITQAAQAATQIAASSQQQVSGMDQVASAMQSINKASLEGVESTRQLESAARNLNDLGQKLQRLVERFRG